MKLQHSLTSGKRYFFMRRLSLKEDATSGFMYEPAGSKDATYNVNRFPDERLKSQKHLH